MSYVRTKEVRAAVLERLIRETFPHGKVRKQLLKRATALRLCGRAIAVRRCGECGEDREHSGRLLNIDNGLSGGQPCGLRCCPSCSRRHATERYERLLAILKTLKIVDGFRLRHFVFTVQRDVQAEEPHTIEAMRATTRAFSQVMAELWKVLKRLGAGVAMLRSQEMSGSGHIHVHVLFYGPFINQAWLGEWFAQAWERWEETTHRRALPDRPPWIEDVSKSDESIAHEIVKYATKGPSPMSERWLRGSPRDVEDPELVARYELAIRGLALTQMYGAFRRKVEPEEVTPAPQPHEDADVACPCCGVVGSWFTVVDDVEATVRRMHAKGRAVLAGSRWRAPEWRGT